ncbi:MAG: glycosyltransferase [Burkholderiales bacterium]|nr:glycosyltransferase [Burkholderiales bacterium]
MTAPLVSICIPAYNERYFGEALGSALAQQGVEVEILVSDDSPGEAIGKAVAAANDPRVRYVRNRERLGFGANFTQCFTLARGEMMKFLNDDDRLRPGCVAALASVLAANPAVKLATSRRQPIDASGARVADIPPTLPVSSVSALMPGRELGDFVLAHSINLIGEPTTVMFRRADVALEEGAIFRWGGRDYHCLADMCLWLRLLAQGLAYYAAAPLSEFRLHAGQEQHREGVRVGCLVERLWIVREARSAGFLAAPQAQRMALASLRARIVPCFGVPGFLPAEEATLRDLLAQVDGEIASLR